MFVTDFLHQKYLCLFYFPCIFCTDSLFRSIFKSNVNKATDSNKRRSKCQWNIHCSRYVSSIFIQHTHSNHFFFFYKNCVPYFVSDCYEVADPLFKMIFFFLFLILSYNFLFTVLFSSFLFLFLALRIFYY